MAKKKQTDNEIIDELVAAATTEETSVVEEVAVVEEPVVVEEPKAAPAPKVEKKAETLAPGEYYQGKRIEKYIARLGKRWVVAIEGKRVKINKDEIVKVK
jgi:hypothetical protein